MEAVVRAVGDYAPKIGGKVEWSRMRKLTATPNLSELHNLIKPVIQHRPIVQQEERVALPRCEITGEHGGVDALVCHSACNILRAD
jgi:hypothetical protein